MVNTILFDLDGTLTDPGMGITNSVAYSLRHFGINVKKREDLYVFIGPPLTDSFIKYYGFSENDAKKAVDIYREYFSETGIFENTVYDGIENMLSELKKAGKTLILATSKPEVFAKRILEHFSLDSYFSFICGSELDHSRTDKHEVIEYALSKLDNRFRDKTIMVGDRLHDINGGKKSSILTLGVTYGYGSRNELKRAGADYIVDTVNELSEVLHKL